MSKKAALAGELLIELQTALSHGTVARRVETLRRVTDLFLHAPSGYSEEQIGLFDDVFHYLIEAMEASAKTLLAERLAPVEQAPPRLMTTLALDDSVNVAAPVLSLSDRISDEVLKRAGSKSQGHMMAIARRKALSVIVTEVLVDRGDEAVVESTVRNPGAQFSDRSIARVVSRAEISSPLANRLGARPIPRHHYLRLVAAASQRLKEKLEKANPDCAKDVASVVNEVRRQAGNAKDDATAQAQSLVELLHRDGRLTEIQVEAFAHEGRVEEMTASIAILTKVPILTVENMMIEPRAEGLLVLAKIAGLSWSTVEKILATRRDIAQADVQTNIQDYKSGYNLLRLSTAQQVLRFYRMRETTDDNQTA